MKKRILKIAAFVFAIALIVGVCVFANALVGNPISKAMATNTAEKHIEKTMRIRILRLSVLPLALRMDTITHLFTHRAV